MAPRLRRLLVPLACLGLQACVAMQMYEGPMRPDNEIAKISPKFAVYGVAAKEIAVVSFDGRAIHEDFPVLEILPGRHLVGMRYAGGFMNAQVRSNGPCFAVVDAVAGGRYQVGGEYLIRKKEWRCWLVDERSGARTPGVFLTGEPPSREALPMLMDKVAARSAELATGSDDIDPVLFVSLSQPAGAPEPGSKNPLACSDEVRKQSTADDRLFADLVGAVGGVGFADEVHHPEGGKRELVRVEVLRPYDNVATGLERWHVRHEGGDTAAYDLTLVPDGEGGTSFQVRLAAAPSMAP